VTNLVTYISFQGDANLGGTIVNGLGQLNCAQDPCIGDAWKNSFFAAQILYTTMQKWYEVTYSTNLLDQVFGLALAAAPNSSPYPGNDFIVSVPSATYTPTFVSMPTLRVNHATIGFGPLYANSTQYPDIGTLLCQEFTNNKSFAELQVFK
jgi:hypothetical protein